MTRIGSVGSRDILSDFPGGSAPAINTDRSSIFLANLLLLSLSFSDVTFNLFGATESTAFPLLIIGLMVLIEGRISKHLIYVVLFLISFFLLAVLNNLTLKTSVVGLAAYLQLAFVYFYFKSHGVLFSLSLCRAVVYFHLGIGFLQTLGTFEALLSPLLSLMLPRFYATALTEIGRGVTFLTTEPSHALQSIILPIFVLSISSFKRDKILAIATVLLTLALSKAGLGMLYVMVMFTVILLAKPKYSPFVIVFALVAFSLLSGRATLVVVQAQNLLSNFNLETLLLAISFSGFRIPSVLAPIIALRDLPSVLGIGAWEVNILDNLYAAGFDVPNLGHWRFTREIHPIKPYSLLANIASDMWWFGVIPFFIFVFRTVLNSVKCKLFVNGNTLAISMFWLSIFAILFLMTMGKPSFIAILGIVAFYSRTDSPNSLNS